MRSSLLPFLLLLAAPAAAETELSFYGGWAGAPDGGVTLGEGEELSLGEAGGAGQVGLRGTFWTGGGLGVGLDLSRFGEAETEDGLSFGLGTVTVNGLYRWEEALGGVTPYVGAGLGLALAEVETEGGEEGEASGAAVSWVAGASVPLGGNWSAFGEYEGTYADVEGDLGDVTIESETVTNSINLGVSFSF